MDYGLTENDQRSVIVEDLNLDDSKQRSNICSQRFYRGRGCRVSPRKFWLLGKPKEVYKYKGDTLKCENMKLTMAQLVFGQLFTEQCSVPWNIQIFWEGNTSVNRCVSSPYFNACVRKVVDSV